MIPATFTTETQRHEERTEIFLGGHLLLFTSKIPKTFSERLCFFVSL